MYIHFIWLLVSYSCDRSKSNKSVYKSIYYADEGKATMIYKSHYFAWGSGDGGANKV
jgi:hypothetical protein